MLRLRSARVNKGPIRRRPGAALVRRRARVARLAASNNNVPFLGGGYSGAFASNGCWYERHDLKFDHIEKTSCETEYFFKHYLTGTSTPVWEPLQLKRQLYFVGYPDNAMLNMYMRDGMIPIDPTAGLNEGGTTTTGSCTEACPKYSTTSLVGACCSCNGVNRPFVRSSFSANYYQCK